MHYLKKIWIAVLLTFIFTQFLNAQQQPVKEPAKAEENKEAGKEEEKNVNDILYIQNGDRLSGEIVSVREGEMSFNSETLGEVKVPWVDVLQVESTRPLYVALKNGEIIKGMVSKGEQEDMWIIDDPKLGKISMRRDEILGVGPTSESVQTSTVELEKAKKELEEKAKALADATDLTKLWSGAIELSCAGNEGNRNTIDLHGKINIKRKTEHELFKAYLYGNYAKRRPDYRATEIKGGISLDVDLTEYFFIWGSTDAEWDESEDLNLRFEVALGVGYHIIKEKNTFLDGKVGAGYISEDYKHADDRHNAMAKLILDFGHTFENKIQIGATFTYAPTFTDIKNYRLIAEAFASFPITDNFKFKVSVIDEYNSEPPEGIRPNDFTWLATLMYEF